jgi:two-component system, cell cycle sensor histidine kinase and response regulator CckA
MTREPTSSGSSLNGTSPTVHFVHSAKQGAERAPTQARPATLRTTEHGATSGQVRSVAAGAAHDMAALLMAIDSNLDLLSAEWLSKEGTESVRSLRTVNSYLRGLTRELRRAGSESATSQRRETSLAVWWLDMAELLRALHGDQFVVRADIPADLPGIFIKSQHLSQIVLNLVANAAHASAETEPAGPTHGGLPDESRSAGVDILARAAPDGKFVSLTIADHGPGMSPSVLARAGEPSFTTRADHGGTGLGLAMVRRLVGAAGGSVRFSSAVGAGTTVTIHLPSGPGGQERAAASEPTGEVSPETDEGPFPDSSERPLPS